MGPRTAVVPPGLEGALDRAVRGLYGSSWGKARAWIAGGKVRRTGEVLLDPTARVRAGDELTLDEGAPRAARGAGRQRVSLSELAVLFCDAQVVVVSKPPGISTVPFGAYGEAGDTLDALVRRWLERKAGKASSRPNLGVVHRLDKETSGLVVFTRTWLAKQRLASQFRAHTVYRRYVAIAHGAVIRATTHRTYLLEDRGDGLRGSARSARGTTPPPSARLAITHVEPLERLHGATLVACRLETGRTHQIRIHLSEDGHPLVGEKVYVRQFAGPLVEAPRLMLHAAELGFVHPATELRVSWEEPLPDDMRRVLDRLRT